jgi:O-antigen ligase
VESSPIDRLVFSSLICLGFVILIRRKVNWLEFAKYNKWVLALFVYMGLSLIWSEFPRETAVRWIRSVGMLIMALIVLTEVNPLEGISGLLRRCYYIHLPLSIISIKYFRDIGVSWSRDGSAEMWTGLTTHKNMLGQISISSGIYFTWNMIKTVGKKNIPRDLLFLLMTLWLLRGSGTSSSMTAIIGFGIGIFVLLGLQYLRRHVDHFGRYIIAWILFLFLLGPVIQVGFEAFVGESLSSSVVGASGRDETLTGRTIMWSDILTIASEKPILGVGYGAFWVGDKGRELPLWSEFVTWSPGQGHNGYIDLYVELGFVGAILMTGVIIAAFKNISKLVHTDFEFARIRIAYLLVVLTNNITESSLTKAYHNLWFIFLLFAINIPFKFESEKSQ